MKINVFVLCSTTVNLPCPRVQSSMAKRTTGSYQIRTTTERCYLHTRLFRKLQVRITTPGIRRQQTRMRTTDADEINIRVHGTNTCLGTPWIRVIRGKLFPDRHLLLIVAY